MKRAFAAASAAAVALVVGAGAAAAAPEPVYPPPSPPTMTVTADGFCIGDVPYFGWETTFEDSDAADDESLTITFRNPSGSDHVLKGQSLSGQAMWPGAAADSEGKGTDWPGWRLEDGVWLEGDEWDWTVPDVDVKFEANPSVVVNIVYPLPSAVCAGPPNPPPAGPDPEEDDLPDLLGLTGSQLGAALGGIAALLAVGTVLVAVRRRTQH